MLESLTILTKGGLILYQYTAEPSLVGADDGAAHAAQALNALIANILLDPTASTKTFHIDDGLTFCWQLKDDTYYTAVYPDILFEGPRQYLRTWAEHLLNKTAVEYNLYRASAVTASVADNKEIRPDPEPFDKTFRVLLEASKNERYVPAAAAATTSSSPAQEEPQNVAAASSSKKGKEMRHWHDGSAKVTEEAMAALDMSSSKEDAGSEDAAARALQEARQAYLPNEEDLRQQENDTITVGSSSDDSANTWSSSVTGLLQQLTGNKVLSDSDLDQPLQQMEELLISKNVAREISHELCESVRSKLVGKRLNSLYRVQTAVKQALESVLTKLLHNEVDLLRNVLAKRGDGALFRMSSTKRAPYVITVMGINGIGKTTSLAKLAYYFKNHGCSPLLVAGDTFRSGAVEQLKVHAQCLEVPLFSQGYSKDPSAVAKAAIQHATEQGNDVVLIDTAGRMQNNVPLMKALGKLVQENKPDFCILVCEALVGHDGLNQFQMFRQALGRRGIDGLILTKFDTVSDKVGAALTLTHQTGSPIIFCGTGQKYTHLKRLSVPAVIESLFA